LDLFVDGQAAQVPEGAGPTLGELLAALRDQAMTDGKAITTIKLDGEELMPDGEDAAGARALAELGRVEISTAPAAEWGRHGLGEAASALGQLADEFRAIADLLRGGRRAESIERFGGAVAGYGQLIGALVNAAALAGVAAPAGFQKTVENVTGAMKEMAPALKAEDAVAAADQAEYELAERLEELGAMVKQMADA
jgi:hypothetical protein